MSHVSVSFKFNTRITTRHLQRVSEWVRERKRPRETETERQTEWGCVCMDACMHVSAYECVHTYVFTCVFCFNFVFWSPHPGEQCVKAHDTQCAAAEAECHKFYCSLHCQESAIFKSPPLKATPLGPIPIPCEVKWSDPIRKNQFSATAISFRGDEPSNSICPACQTEVFNYASMAHKIVSVSVKHKPEL